MNKRLWKKSYFRIKKIEKKKRLCELRWNKKN